MHTGFVQRSLPRSSPKNAAAPLYNGGDSSSVPGALAFEYVARSVVSSLAPRATRRPDERRPRAPRLRRGSALSPELSGLFEGTASGDAAAAICCRRVLTDTEKNLFRLGGICDLPCALGIYRGMASR